jgi:hypothetical protein
MKIQYLVPSIKTHLFKLNKELCSQISMIRRQNKSFLKKLVISIIILLWQHLGLKNKIIFLDGFIL